jgi:hypothetical protein
MTWNEIWPLLIAAASAGLGALLVELLYRILRGLSRLVWRKSQSLSSTKKLQKQWTKRGKFSSSLLDRMYRPVQTAAAAFGAWIPLHLTEQEAVAAALLLSMAIACGWLVVAIVLWMVAGATSIMRFGGSDAARRFQSQADTLRVPNKMV